MIVVFGLAILPTGSRATAKDCYEKFPAKAVAKPKNAHDV